MLQVARNRTVAEAVQIVHGRPVHERLGVIYIRVSTEDQAENNQSLKTQRGDCLDYARRMGIRIVQVYLDVGSGLSLKKRPDFVKMFETAMSRESGITDVLFWELDRFSRRMRHFIEFTEDMIAAGINLHLVSEEEMYNEKTEQNWKYRAIAAEGESRKISKRTKRGQRETTERGRNIGMATWGYRIRHEPGEEDSAGWLVPDPDLWPHVLRLWRLALEGYTPQQIAYTYDQENIPPPGDGGWKDDAVRYILKNEKYKGVMFRGKERVSRLPGQPDRTPPTVQENAHEAAVSPEDFERVQQIIAGRHRSQGPTRSHSSDNPLSDILQCGECGENHGHPNMTISKKDGIIRLRCARKKKLGKPACNNNDIRLDLVVERTIQFLRDEFITDETLRNVVRAVQERSGAYLSEYEERKLSLADNLKTVRTEIDNINSVIRTQGMKASNLSSLLDSLAELERKERELAAEIERINDDTEEARLFVNDPEGIIEAALNLKTYTESTEGPAVRQLVKMFVERAEIFRWQDDKTRNLKLWLSLPARSAESDESPGTKTIVFDRKGEPVLPESCLLGGSTGLG